MSEALPCAVVSVDGVCRRVLVDTGCSVSVVHVACCKSWMKGAVDMVTVSGEKWRCEGTSIVHLQLSGGAATDIRVCVTTAKPLGFMAILGMNGIIALGGVAVDAQNRVQFGIEKPEICAATNTVVKVEEHDFSGTYDPSSNCWTAAWKWSKDKEPGVL